MKRVLTLIAVAIAIAFATASTAHAQEFQFDPENFTPEGVENLVRYIQRTMKTDARVSNMDGTGVRFSDQVIDGFIEYLDTAEKYLGKDITLSQEEMNQVITYLMLMKESDSRLYIYQKSDGTLGAIRHDRPFLSPQIGAMYSMASRTVRPYVALAYGKMGAHIWRDGAGHSVPIFGYEGALFVSYDEYGPQAYSAGEKYLSYGGYVLGKVQLFESKWVKHRINLVAGGICTYYQDDTKLYEKKIFFEGFGLEALAGLEYQGRLGDKGGNHFVVKGTFGWEPWVALNTTQYNATFRLSAGITFGQHYKIR